MCGLYCRLELVEREPGTLEQNIRLVRQEVSSVAGQLQEVPYPYLP